MKQCTPAWTQLSGKYKQRKFVTRYARFIYIVCAILTAGIGSAVLAMTGPSITAIKSHTPSGPFHLGDTITYSTTINNSGVAATGVTFTDTPDPNTTLVAGSISASPVAVNDGPYACTGNLSISVPAASGVLANDFLGLNPAATIAAFDAFSANGGTVSMTTSGANAGAFTYEPPAGFTGTDTFTYTLTNSVGSSTGTVSIDVSGMIWFINNADGAGDGRFASPFNSLAAFQAVNDGGVRHPASGNTIFIYQGTASYAGPLTLLSNQSLIGQGDSLSFTVAPDTNVTLPVATAKPILTGTVTLATGVSVLAVNLSTGVNNGLAGSGGLTGVTVGDLSPTTTNGVTVTTTTGTAVSLNNVSGTFTFYSISSSGGTNGISLTNTTGSFTVTGGGASDPTNMTQGRTAAEDGGGTLVLGAGGTIAGQTGAAVLLNSATNVTLQNMILGPTAGTVNGGQDGINAASVTDLTLDNMLISGMINNYGVLGSAVSGLTIQHSNIGDNGTETSNATISNIDIQNLSGAVTVENSVFGTSGNTVFQNAFFIDECHTGCGAPALSMDVNNSLFENVGQYLLNIAAEGSSNVTLTVQDSTFENAPAGSINYVGTGTSGGGALTIESNTFSNDGSAGGASVNIDHDAAGSTLQFNITGNTMRQTLVTGSSAAVSVSTGPQATVTTVLEGYVTNNTIGKASVTDSGSDLSSGIAIGTNAPGTLTASVTGNTVLQSDDDGILVLASSPSTSNINVTVSGNDAEVSPTDPNTNLGLELTTGGDAGTDVICANVSGNTKLIGNSGVAGVATTAFTGAVIELQGYTGAANNNAAIATFLDGTATTVSPAGLNFGGGGTVEKATSACPTPPTAPTPLFKIGKVTEAVKSNVVQNASSDTETSTVSSSQNTDVLHAAFGPAPIENTPQKITSSDASATLQQALYRWWQSGITAQDMDRLTAATITVADLPEGQLASTTANRITIDATAAGYGWFIDSTPGDDSKFDVPVPNKERQTTQNSQAFGKMDLLTVVMRGLGYVYLQGATSFPKSLKPLMNSELSPGVRRIPDSSSIHLGLQAQNFNSVEKDIVADQSPEGLTMDRPHAARKKWAIVRAPGSSARVRYAVADGSAKPQLKLVGFGHALNRKLRSTSAWYFGPPPVDVTVGTLPAGQSVTITFQATVNNPLTSPSTATTVSNTGAVSGTNFSTTNTNTDTANLCVSPVITTALSNQTVTPTNTATFTTTLTGSAPFTFVWKQGSTILVSGTSLGGRATITTSTAGNATTSTLSISNAAPSDAGSYSAAGTDACSDPVTNQSATLTVGQPASINKAFGAASIPFGATTSLTFTISNPNSGTVLNGIAFTDNLPAGMNVATPSGLSSTCSGTATGSAGSSSVSLSGATLAASASCTVSLNVQGTAVVAASNSVTVSDTTVGTGNTSTAPLTVVKSDTATAVTSSVNPSVFGQSVTLTATVSPVAPGAGTPTGTVTFLDGGGPIGTGTIIGGVATFTTSAFAVGNHTITTSYGGDGNFNGSTGSLTGNPQVVNKANTVTTVTSSVNPSVFGQSVTLTATVSPVAPGAGTPTGTVTFLDGGSPIGTGTIIGGVATFTTSAFAVGNHTITTSYGGDGNFNGSTGSLIGNPQVVNKADTATTVTSSQNPQIADQSVTFTATVSPVAPGAGTPTGTVTFLDGGSPIGSGTLIGGVATFTTSALSPGSHTITTSYGGDGNFNGSTGSLIANPEVINQSSTTTSVSSSQGTITLGDTVTFTATVTAGAGTPTGIVTFFDGATPLGSGILNEAGLDQATFSTALLSASGSPHSITATYQGVTAFGGSTSAPISETVNERTSTTGVVLNPTTVVVGQVSTATITLTDSGSVPPGTADTFTTTGALATGRTGFTSTLFADGLVLVAGGTGSNGTTVLNSAEIYSVSGADFSTTGNLNIARTGAVAALLPNGLVLVAGGSSDGTANGALNTAELFNPNTGTFSLAGSGSGNLMTAARFGATATLLNNGQVLIAAGQNSGGVLNSAELYNPATDTFTATGNLNTARTGTTATLLGTGKVLVTGGSGDGTANGALNSAEVFDPAGNSGAGTFTSVAGANPTLASGRWQPEAALLLSGKVLIAGGQNSGGALTSADLYDPVADSFTASAQNMSQARANGLAVAMPNGMVLLAGGTTSQAVDLYDADSDRFDSTGSLQQSDAGLVSTLLNNGQVLVVGLTTGATPASDAELYTPSFNPLGTVGLSSSEATDSFGSACVLTPSTSTASSCTSTITPVNVNTSPHTITGTYPADAVHSGSSNTASLTVNKADTTTTVTSSVNPSVYGQSVTFTATVSPVAPGTGSPTGTITFLDGGSPIGTGTLSGGVATFTTSSLAAGNHTITTSYGGDANSNGSTGSLTGNPQVVNKSDTATTVTSSLNPALAGQSVTFTATVSPVAPGAGTPTGTVTFLDGGSPIGTGTLSGGVATFSTSALALGNHTITTSYGGDGNFNGSTGSLTGNPQVVNKASTTTTVTSSQNPSALGQSVTFTATISVVAPGTGTPTGTVTFLDGGNSIGTGTLSGGVATFTTSSLAAGNHTITTSYGGDTNFSGNTGSLTGNPQIVVAPPTDSVDINPSLVPPNTEGALLAISVVNPAANTVALTGVAFTATLPAGVIVASPNGLTSTCGGTATAVAGSSTISLSGATIAINSGCSMLVNVIGTTVGSYNIGVNGAGTVTSSNGGTGVASNTYTLNVANPPTISKAFGAASIALNGSTSLTFNIANPAGNPVSLSNMAFTDSLPAGLIVATPNGLTGSCGGGIITATAGSSSISMSGTTLAAAANCSFAVNVTGTVAGVKNNTTSSLSSNLALTPGLTSNTATITVVAPPTFSKAFGTASIPLAGTTSLTFSLGNGNTTVGLTGVGFVDNLPAGLVVATPNGLTNSCGGTVTANAGASSVTLAGGSIAASSNCTVVVNVTGVNGASLVNVTGNVSSTNGGTGGTATASITVLAPDMTITKSHTGNFSQGDSGDVYTITASNSGTVPTVGTVTVVDTLPAGLTATAISGTGWSCTLNTLTCTRNDALGATSSYPDITVTVNVAGNCPTSVTNTATVSGGGESNTANDTATDVTTVIQVGPPLAITLLSNGITVYDGQSGSIQFTIATSVPNPPPITFACSGLPLGAACGFSPSSITQATGTVTMTISTLGRVPQNSPAFSRNRDGRGMSPLYASITIPGFGLGLAVVVLGGRKRNKRAKIRLLGIIFGALLLFAFAGCGSSTPYGTPAGRYPITVTATSGSTQTSAIVNLSVLR